MVWLPQARRTGRGACGVANRLFAVRRHMARFASRVLMQRISWLVKNRAVKLLLREGEAGQARATLSRSSPDFSYEVGRQRLFIRRFNTRKLTGSAHGLAQELDAADRGRAGLAAAGSHDGVVANQLQVFDFDDCVS